MKKMIKYPSIEQFRTVVSNVNRRYNFTGLDENGEAIYDPSLPKPVLTFKGTVKLHGTNASVCYNKQNGLWVQSRENIITPEKDNAGFAFFVESNKDAFINLFGEISIKNDLGYLIDVEQATITIYGEWAGGNIQKGVGISNLPKSFFIFGIKVTPHTETEEELKANPAYWIDSTDLRNPDVKIYNIDDYPTYSIEIDFNMPQLVQNQLSEITTAVEEECPVAKAFGFSGIGEGIVWSCEYQGVVHRFKCKGELHAGKSKVTTLKPVDDEKLNKIINVVNQVTPTWRLEQMLSETFDLINGGEIDIKQLGSYIKAVINDIIKEETLLLSENGLEPKDIGKYVSETSRQYFFQRLNEVTGIK
jgi:hypothetical protein